MAHSSSNSGLNGIIDLLAGSFGGAANVLVGQPLDTVKVIYSIRYSNKKKINNFSFCYINY